MKNKCFLFALNLGILLGLICGCQTVSEQGHLRNVDPYIGSDGHGHVFVGASVPMGMVQVGPENIHKGWDWCSGYHYSDSVLIGFAHTHLNGTGCNDMGDIMIMPFIGELRCDRGTQENIEGSCSSYYSHENEMVTPGYYSLRLDNGVFAEMTATDRTAFHHYVYPAGETPRLLIDLVEGNDCEAYETYIKKVSDHQIEGYRYTEAWSPNKKVFFVLQTSSPIAGFNIFNEDELIEGDEMEGEYVKGVITFQENDVNFKVAISSVSCENAKANLVSEIPHWNFSEVRESAESRWEEILSCIDVESKNESAKRVFYTSLYHMFVSPTLYCDVDGRFRGQDDKIYTADKWKNYSTLSLWDTYRAYHPLVTLIYPQMIPDVINSMMFMCDQQGKLPIWALYGGETNTMPGYSSVPVIADAYLKGIKGFDAERALACMVKSATFDEQVGVPYVMEKGYIPCDKQMQATSIAMEYAVDDWGIAMMAKAMGHDDIYKEFYKRGHYYEQYYDKSTNFVRPIMSDGTWRTPYNPFNSDSEGDFCEGNGWHYTFFVPQYPEHMIELLGGEEMFINKLDSLFIAEGDMGEDAPVDISGLIGMYAHGNEPSHHIAYLYTYAGQQWKAAEKISYIQNEFYTDQPDGLIGNEDCGQMSAWHIMSALGFYQVNPTNGVYVFGTPRFEKVTLHLPLGSDFTIEAENVSADNIYIQSATLNGMPYEKTFITHKDLLAGGKLVFQMGNQPNMEYGSKLENRPKSI